MKHIFFLPSVNDIALINSRADVSDSGCKLELRECDLWLFALVATQVDSVL